MQREFTKMHGIGNDFVVLNAIDQPIALSPAQIRAIANRRTGIGCDQLLLVEPSTHPDTDFNYRIFNADGGEVEHCGNGARCFALFVREQGLSDKATIAVNTHAGVIELTIEEDGQVAVNMGVPDFAPASIPLTASSQEHYYAVDVAGRAYQFGAVSIGNPHAVLDVDDVEHAPVNALGEALQSHARFPQRVNVGFRQIIDRRTLRLRVFERGVGETRACGTGACAAVATGVVQGVLDSTVRVSLPGGDLMIHWPGEGRPIVMTGPATSVYRGTIDL